MKFNRFTEKALRKEFPFLGEIFDGTLPIIECRACNNMVKGGDFDHVSVDKHCECGAYHWSIKSPANRPVSPEKVLIKRIDEDYLNSTPEFYRWIGSVVDMDQGTEVIFVLRDGTVMRNAVERDGQSGSKGSHSDTYYCDGESVLHAIDRHGVENSLEFIVERQYGIHTTDHHSHGQRLVVRKPGKGLLVVSLIAAAYMAASDQVAAEADL